MMPYMCNWLVYAIECTVGVLYVSLVSADLCSIPLQRLLCVVRVYAHSLVVSGEQRSDDDVDVIGCDCAR